MSNNFDRNLLRNARDIDLQRAAEVAAMREKLEEAIKSDPWFGIAVDFDRIPNSCLYEILRNEAYQMAQWAERAAQALMRGDPGGMLTVMDPSNGRTRPLDPNLVAVAINGISQAAIAKATLANAAADMARIDAEYAPRMVDGTVPRWNDLSGDPARGYGEVYRLEAKAKMEAAAAAAADAAGQEPEADSNLLVTAGDS